MPTTSTSLFIKLLKENGMDAKSDVDMLQVQIGSEPGPFIGGQGKVAVLYEPGLDQVVAQGMKVRSEEHTSELQSLMRISYAVFCLKKKNKQTDTQNYY